MYRSLIASAVRRTIVAPTYLHLPSGPIRPGDLVRYDPARPYVVSHARDIPLIEVLEALQREEYDATLSLVAPDPRLPGALDRPVGPLGRPVAPHLRLIP